MSSSNHYVDFYSGSEVEVLRVKDLLEGGEIPSIIQNDLQSGNLGGFFGGTFSTIRLKVQEADLDKARKLLASLDPNNQNLKG
ncbi:putative signal transducing protein [Salinimicrobium xinjiangense]|uniref:putative signal transducing protein n=1 Tax=Salinimicrobium xinjiangense TaxID=438596 RepID=UPI0004241594|nr:DUF2007 domain-containing protein [Salinimicrobium xinjiangense]